MSPAELLVAAEKRLVEANGIADSLRHNERLHHLAMKAVFVLEDCVFTLINIVDPLEKPEENQRW